MRLVKLIPSALALMIGVGTPTLVSAQVATPAGQTPAAAQSAQLQAELSALEQASGGRLGVHVMRRDGTAVLSYRSDERFAMCSSFKLPLAAVVLHAVQEGRLSLSDLMQYSRDDLPGHSPVLTEALNGRRGAVTVAQALSGTVMFSDNGAANLLLARINGPEGFTQGMRHWGDSTTRLDRIEGALNENARGDERDTSTPIALNQSLAAMIYGDRLSSENRNRLRRWTNESPTGTARFRAGLPVEWNAGDKTGTCYPMDHPDTQVNDIGWFETADGTGYLFAVMLDRPTHGSEQSQAVIANVARLAVQHLQ